MKLTYGVDVGVSTGISVGRTVGGSGVLVGIEGSMVGAAAGSVDRLGVSTTGWSVETAPDIGTARGSAVQVAGITLLGFELAGFGTPRAVAFSVGKTTSACPDIRPQALNRNAVSSGSKRRQTLGWITTLAP